MSICNKNVNMSASGNNSMQKDLSVAFIWHMHQPNYQTQPNGIRLMPWTRLHAIKDYLDMLIILDKFPKIKLNFSLSPDLLDVIEDYANKDGHDIHSKLTITPVNELTDDDKLYILNYFFEANYKNLISKNPRYNELYLKRYGREEVSINDFTNQEYADIMALFNIVWFDPIWKNVYPELKKLEEKGKNYTIKDRIQIIELNRKIIRQIIPTFKKYQEEGRIEILTSPYNHPILPILINCNDLKVPSLKYPLPEFNVDFSADAKEQIELGIQKTKEVFGKTPKGFWPSEHCISQKTLDLLADLGIEWIVTDESVLSNTIKKQFIRDFRGCYEDPYDVCSLYEYRSKHENDINLLFRNSVMASLIGFEYAHRDSVYSANDLFDRIKTIHDKLRNSPDEKHILTIAMDGENSWDAYPNDGATFLERIYSLIENDTDIKTVLVSDYIEENKKTEKPLKKVSTGSWLNQEFQLWIAEPTKNLAWQYLAQTKAALKNAMKSKKLTKSQISAAKSEIFIAEGSDWFWWYGEPNNSDQDNIFDFLFREHLKNVYTIINEPIPEELEMPLISYIGKPLRNPRRQITPNINGLIQENDEWLSAGCIELPTGPILKETKLVNRIYFGTDKDNLYIRFDKNSYFMNSSNNFKEYFSIYVYIKTHNAYNETASVRTTNKAETMHPILIDKYTYEIKYGLTPERKFPLQFSKAMPYGLWELQWNHNIKYAQGEIFETAIPYKDLGIAPGENFEFFFLTGCSGVTEEIYPKDIPLSLTRPL